MQNRSDIQEHMEVIGAEGDPLGTVDRIEGQTIKLCRSDENAGGQHHWIPMDWVDHVDQHVHLNKNCGEATRQWQTAAPEAPRM